MVAMALLNTRNLPLAKGTARVPKKDIAATHLRLRWTLGEADFVCFYELVLALNEHDCRREQEPGPRGGRRPDLPHKVVELGETRRSAGRDPCVTYPDPHLMFDTPYRDGAHAKWDAPKLGWLPVYVVALDGTYLKEVAP